MLFKGIVGTNKIVYIVGFSLNPFNVVRYWKDLPYQEQLHRLELQLIKKGPTQWNGD